MRFEYIIVKLKNVRSKLGNVKLKSAKLKRVKVKKCCFEIKVSKMQGLKVWSIRM